MTAANNPAPQTASYGFWKSPITSDLIVATNITLVDVINDKDDTYWVESRPQEGRRYVVVRGNGDSNPQDVTPPEFNASTQVHEYGGGAVLVKDRIIYFSNFVDQKLYRQEPHGLPRAISQGPQCRYAETTT